MSGWAIALRVVLKRFGTHTEPGRQLIRLWKTFRHFALMGPPRAGEAESDD